MKKLKLFKLLVSIHLLGIIHFSANAIEKVRLVWNADPAHQMTIGWNHESGEEAIVYYDEKDHGSDWKKYSYKISAGIKHDGYQGMKIRFAILKKLKADTVYYFVFKEGDKISSRYWFKTAPDTPKAFTFLAGGDTKSSGSALEAGRMSNRMVPKLRPLFILFNGDFNTGNGTNPERWKLWLDDWFKLTQTKDGRLFPIVPVHGNHEDGDFKVLNRIFNAPYQNNKPNQIYYSLNIGGDFLHVVCLNSQITKVLKEQTQWLEKDLQEHANSTFKVVGYHKPFWPHTTSKKENKHLYEAWAGLFYKYKVSLSLDGDSHMTKTTYPLKPDPKGDFGFVRDDINGTIYSGEGSWGAAPRKANDKKSWTMRTGSFNQVKWFHVLPKSGDTKAQIKLNTVITAEFKDKKMITTVPDVEALAEDELFKTPKNIKLFGEAITYPFK